MKLNKKMLSYIIYIFLVSVFEIFLFMSYSYSDSAYLIIFAMSFYVVGFFIINEYYKTKSFFSLRNIFNLFGVLYTNYYIVQLIMNNINISKEIYFSMFLSYISILFFNIGYVISKQKKHQEYEKKENKGVYQTKIIIGLMLIFFIFSVVAEAYVIFYKIGFSSYINASRAQQAKLMLDYSILSFYKSTIPLTSMVYLYIYLKYNNKISKFIFGISFIISILNAIISVSRAELLSILLPILFLLNHFKKISTKSVIVLGIIGFVLFGAWKGLANGETNVISYDSEFNSWYTICSNILSDKTNFKYLYGSSYLKTIFNLIVPITNTTSLSTWYVKTYEYSVYLRGGGRGFSGVLEAYMNFGIAGNIIVYSFYGWLLKKMNKESDLDIIIYMILMTSIFQMFRSESYSLWKSMVWFKIFPVLIIFWLSRRNKINKDSKEREK